MSLSSNPKYDANAYFLTEGYNYSASIDSLAAGETKTTTVQLSTDADFFVTQGSYWCNQASNEDPTQFERPSASILVSIQDTANGNQLFREPVPIDTVFGNGENPFQWPEAYGIAGGGTLVFTFTNIGAVEYQNIYTVLSGLKAYRRDR